MRCASRTCPARCVFFGVGVGGPPTRVGECGGQRGERARCARGRSVAEGKQPGASVRRPGADVSACVRAGANGCLPGGRAQGQQQGAPINAVWGERGGAGGCSVWGRKHAIGRSSIPVPALCRCSRDLCRAHSCAHAHPRSARTPPSPLTNPRCCTSSLRRRAPIWHRCAALQGTAPPPALAPFCSPLRGCEALAGCRAAARATSPPRATAPSIHNELNCHQ
jgi:hypothetical protein